MERSGNRGGGRRSTRDSRGDRRSSSGEPPQEPPEVPLSDPQEIVELPKREGRTWHPVEVDRHVRMTRSLIAEADKQSASRFWLIGDASFELYNGFPERAKGEPKFIPWAVQALGVRERDLREFLRIRHRIPSEEQATAYGRRRIALGFRLMKKLDIDTFEALEKRDLPLPDGETCRFPAPVRHLEAALLLLAKKKKATGSKKLVGKARRYNEALKLERPNDDVLDGIRGGFIVEKSELKFDNKAPLTLEQCVALARFVSRLEDDE